MLEKLNEPIEVLAQFKNSAPIQPASRKLKMASVSQLMQYKKQVIPLFFKWRNKTYKIEKINLVHKERDGNDKIYYFSVSDNANYFRLAFFTRDLSWRIEELYYEG